MFKCKWFKAYELVSKAVYNKFGELSWQFFDADVLADLDTIRETWGASITINNWYWGGQYNESGLRSNIDSILKGKKTLYLSSHVLGCGFDLKDGRGRNAELHAHICNLIKQKKLRKIRRVEDLKSTPTWCHCDAFQTTNDVLTVFKV